jgi:uncharacterized oxidoreductase
MFSVFVDPARIDPEGLFPAEAARYVDFVKAAHPAPPATEALLPGEPEARVRAQRLTAGVPLPEEIWQSIVQVAQSLGVDERRIPQPAALQH